MLRFLRWKTLLSLTWLACSNDTGAGDAGGNASVEAAAPASGVLPLPLSRQELLKPETCKSCHPKHYREWSGSMHAYAAEDPVFLAMNARGQRETNGELGDFCVQCHAPMAVREGLTRDGLNLAALPNEVKGVTCYFCHNAIDVADDHNAPIQLANDTTMRGALENPVNPGVHGVANSRFHDRRRPESSRMCGSCHDVVTPGGVHIERTFKEHLGSAYAFAGAAFQTCQTCHMDGRRGKAANMGAANLPERIIHEHLWPGVDTALTEFPDRGAQRLAVECALASSATVVSLTPSPTGEFTVALETEAGHAQPSGTSQDRRLWIEFVAYDKADNIVYQSALTADGQPEPKPTDSALDPSIDPRPTVFNDRIYDANGKEVHMFWDARPSTQYPTGYSSQLLVPPTQITVRHTVSRTWTVPSGLPARVEIRMRVRAVSHEILQDLIESKDLDPSFLAKMPTFTLRGTEVEWKVADGFAPITVPKPSALRCPDDYRCLLDPSEEGCSK